MKKIYQSNCIILAVIIFSIFQTQTLAQKKGTVNRSFFKNGLVAKEFYFGADKMLDSLKTYHIVGGLDERFYFDENNWIDGLCQKFSSDGKLKTIWLYKKNVLIKRTDYFKEDNLKNKAKVEENYNTIINNNELLKLDPNNFGLLYGRAAARLYLEDNVLAEFDFLGFKSQLENIKSNPSEAKKFPSLNKDLAEIYSRLSTIYSRFENDNASINYKLMAIQTDPTETRHYFNLGAYLATEVHDYRLGIYYLNEVVKKIPSHNFAHWVLGYSYLELDQYEKAAENINIAFENEANLYENGYGNEESDLRTIRGLAYHKLGKTDLGIADLKEAIKINPKNSVAHKYLGIIYYDLNEKEKACEYFQKSRTLGYEKKYFNKELESYINNACGTSSSNKKGIETAFKDLPYIAPNPAENAVEVFNFPNEDFKFEVFTVESKMMLQGISSNKTIDVSRLFSGFYILTISGKEKVYSFKLIKK
ncbi:putative secreted protein (Por secretion system target) [Flavobacterium sp. 270]|uniref:T9SS type A sorting domain-containing protein n=1 Tax=Flavobacterium sp. 270 TaxID=2512114 RepID=UPI0010E824B1|nr:T9SS type A sorting domain-containing protein [Flavobacterium sp. 270]TDW46086.1 putative secreted protein (Por secretion system target) [Flavobacterium sp. 270]